MKDILIIAVNYNTNEETIRFIKSIAGQQAGVGVVLVDNSDVKKDAALGSLLKAMIPDLIYIDSGKNLGYFGAAAYGLDWYLKNNPVPDFVIVSNVDIVIEQDKFFEKLVALSPEPEIGVLAPSIISKKWKTDANPKVLEKYTLEKMKFYRLVCTNAFTQNAYTLLSYLKKMLAGRKNNSHAGNGPARIYAPHGAFIIFTQQYFKHGGNFNHFSFLFGEEIFVAESAKKIGLDVLYVPSLRVEDYEHASTGFFYSRRTASLMKQSTADIITQYYSSNPD